jgi:hypothetical protein
MIDAKYYAAAHTLVEIDEKIADYEESYKSAIDINSYDIADTQTRQKVESDPDKIEKMLAMLYEARALKNGDLAGAKLYAGRFQREI